MHHLDLSVSDAVSVTSRRDVETAIDPGREVRILASSSARSIGSFQNRRNTFVGRGRVTTGRVRSTIK